MDSTHPHIILPTNATSAANPLAATTPTAIARDTVVQTNPEGEPEKYVEIIKKEIDHPASKPTSTDMTTKTTTTTTTTTTQADEDPKSKDYVVKEADVYKPFAVVSDTTPVNSPNNQIVGTTASGSLTTPGKIVGDLEPVLAEHEKAVVVEPVDKKVTTTTKTTETKE